LSPSLVIIADNTGHFWDNLWFVSDGELVFSQPNVFLSVLTNSAGLHAEVPENHGEGADHAGFKDGQTSPLDQLRASGPTSSNVRFPPVSGLYSVCTSKSACSH
jgi:hypothetical protein